MSSSSLSQVNQDESVFTVDQIITNLCSEQWEFSRVQSTHDDRPFVQSKCADPDCTNDHSVRYHSSMPWVGEEHFLCYAKLHSTPGLTQVLKQSYLRPGAHLITFMRLQYLRVKGHLHPNNTMNHFRASFTNSLPVTRFAAGNTPTHMTYALAKSRLQMINEYLRAEHFRLPQGSVPISKEDKYVAAEMGNFVQPILDEMSSKLGLAWSLEDLDNEVLNQLSGKPGDREITIDAMKDLESSSVLCRMRLLQNTFYEQVDSIEAPWRRDQFRSLRSATPRRTGGGAAFDLGREMLERIEWTLKYTQLYIDDENFLKGEVEKWQDLAEKAGVDITDLTETSVTQNFSSAHARSG